jgi:DNA-binding transcriptional LysR family regulator
MEYLVRVVEAHGFAAAARELGVSAPAVTQMVAALENELGVKLLVRGANRVTLTADGEQYYRISAQMISELRIAEANLRTGAARVSGLLLVGMPIRIARNCVVPELGKFLARHPDLSIELRTVNTTDEPDAACVDVLVVNAWHHYEDMVEKHVAHQRYIVCASPAYVREHGTPCDPDELADRPTVAFRTSQGVALTEWKFQRGEQLKSITIKPRIVCDDRDTTFEVALRGLGIVRGTDLVMGSFITQGLLVPVLRDWEALEAPPIRVLYRRDAANSARVRVFIEFIEEVFGRLKALRTAGGYNEPKPQEPPAWFLRLNRYPPGAIAR